MRLQIISHEEYILSSKDFEIEKRKRKKDGMNNDNGANFLIDLSNGHLARYLSTYVAYTEGILCGQCRDRDILLENATYELCTSNISILKIPKRWEELEI